jgi:hypothetical protein
MPIYVVPLGDDHIAYGLVNHVYRHVSAAELYGILRRRDVTSIWMAATDPIYLCVEDEMGQEWYAIDSDAYFHFLHNFIKYGKEREQVDWRKVGF